MLKKTHSLRSQQYVTERSTLTKNHRIVTTISGSGTPVLALASTSLLPDRSAGRLPATSRPLVHPPTRVRAAGVTPARLPTRPRNGLRLPQALTLGVLSVVAAPPLLEPTAWDWTRRPPGLPAQRPDLGLVALSRWGRGQSSCRTPPLAPSPPSSLQAGAPRLAVTSLGGFVLRAGIWPSGNCFVGARRN
jgi:hypothetical protein